MSLPCTFSVDSNAHAYYNTDSALKLTMKSQKLVCFPVICCILNTVTVFVGSMWWHIWLRHCATSRFPIVSLTFFIGIIFPATVWPWVDLASNSSEYQEYFVGDKCGMCIGLTNLPPSCADYQNNWKHQPHRTPKACQGLHRDYLTFTFAIFVMEKKGTLPQLFIFFKNLQ